MINFKSLFDSKIAKIIGGTILIVLIIILILGGMGLFATLLWVVIFLLAIYVCSLKAIRSIIFAFLFIEFAPELKTLFLYWTDNESLYQTISFLTNMGLIKLTVFTFFLSFMVGFITGSVKMFNITNTSTIENEKNN